jgi:hypothetical protein
VARADPWVEQFIDGDVQSDDEVVEDGAHEAFSLKVSVVVATPILGDLLARVRIPNPPLFGIGHLGVHQWAVVDSRAEYAGPWYHEQRAFS